MRIGKHFKLGVIVRCDNSGLGIQSWEFCQHIKPWRIFVLRLNKFQEFPERFKNLGFFVHEGKVENLIKSEFLKDIHILLSFETFYDWSIVKVCRNKDIKTILWANYEWLPEVLPYKPDLILAPSSWNLNNFPSNTIFLPFPVNTAKCKFKVRRKAKRFLYIHGHGGVGGRNGWDILREAIPLVQSNVEFIIYSQFPLDVHFSTKKVFFRGHLLNYEDLYKEGDVLVFPRRYGGQSLVLNEAMVSGLPVIAIDCPPQNEFLHKDLLIKPEKISTIKLKRLVKVYDILPQSLAKKIDEVAFRSVVKYSKLNYNYAMKISWKNLRAVIIDTLRSVL